MVLRNAWAIALLVGLTGCESTILDFSADCLAEHNNSPRCCPEGTHVDHGTCCYDGTHEASDVEHPDWRICILDEDPCADAGADAGACQDAGTGAEADAGADAQ
jgi:hypothetical protein